MLKQFTKYVSQNMLGMLGMSLYILADTYFISKAVGSNGITALNLVLPLYNLIFAIGAMIGVGSAIRFVIERGKKNPDADGYFFHALICAFFISLIFVFIGIFLPDKLVALLGRAMPKSFRPELPIHGFLCVFPHFLCGTISATLLCEMIKIHPSPWLLRYSAVYLTLSLTTF